MPAVLFETPPALTGTEAEQLERTYSYLYQLAEQLNHALSTIDAGNFSNAEAAQRVLSGTAEKEAEENATRLTQTRSLIIKTAEVIHQEMDVIQTNLIERYEAISEDFGRLEESLDARITATARGIVQEYNYSQAIEALQQYQTDISAYIKTGVIGEENGVPIFGVAIGKDITQMVDGVETVNEMNKLATFTTEELAFWRNGIRVATYADGKMIIDEAVIRRTMTIGNYAFAVQVDGSFGIKYTGG
jgi:hypothetical protein